MMTGLVVAATATAGICKMGHQNVGRTLAWSRPEKHKAELSAANNRELERLKSDLRIRSLEHGVRYRDAHKRQAEVFADVYEKLYRLFKAADS